MNKALLCVALIATACIAPARGQESRAPTRGQESRAPTHRHHDPSAQRAQAVNVRSAAEPMSEGQWSPPVDIGVLPVHATLLHTGEILLFGYPEEAGKGSEARLLDPTTGVVTDVTIPFELDIHCAANSVLADGRVLITGGTVYGTFPAHNGITDTTIFDPRTREWSSSGSMADPRWYPTNVQLGSGKILVVTGEVTNNVLMPTMDIYDPTSGMSDRLPSTADSNTDPYATMFLLPGGNVFRAGPNPTSKKFNPATNTWSTVAKMNFGWRYGSNAVLLPDLNRVLIAGGANIPLAQRRLGTPATASAEMINLKAAPPRWRRIAPMNFPRMHANMVQLPDSKILVVGGARFHRVTEPVRQAEMYDPARGTWTVMAAQAADRGYHSSALLLPDGRVMSTGSDESNLPTTVEYYSPPYLFNGPRPIVVDAPASVGYGQAFTVTTPDAADITRVALIRAGSVTHATNFDQRMLNLSFTRGTGTLEVRAPAGPRRAPSGYYMLFIVNSQGVPAVAKFMRVG